MSKVKDLKDTNLSIILDFAHLRLRIDIQDDYLGFSLNPDGIAPQVNRVPYSPSVLIGPELIFHLLHVLASNGFLISCIFVLDPIFRRRECLLVSIELENLRLADRIISINF